MKWLLAFLIFSVCLSADLMPPRSKGKALLQIFHDPNHIGPVMQFTTTPHRLVLEWTTQPEWATHTFVVRALDLLAPELNAEVSFGAPNYWHDIAFVSNTNRFAFVPSGANSFHVSRLCDSSLEGRWEDDLLSLKIRYQ